MQMIQFSNIGVKFIVGEDDNLLTRNIFDNFNLNQHAGCCKNISQHKTLILKMSMEH